MSVGYLSEYIIHAEISKGPGSLTELRNINSRSLILHLFSIKGSINTVKWRVLSSKTHDTIG